MKLLTFKLILILLIALAAPMIIPGPDGEPIMTIDDWIPRDLINSVGSGIDSAGSVLSDAVDATGEAVDGSGGNQIYTWRDAQGVLHYSDTPVENAQALELDDNTLEIPAKNFVEHGMVQDNKKKRKKARSILLEDGRFSGQGLSASGSSSQSANSAVDLGDIEALASGDLSIAAEVLQNLPELLEQVKQARQTDPETR